MLWDYVVILTNDGEMDILLVFSFITSAGTGETGPDLGWRDIRLYLYKWREILEMIAN